MDEWILQPQNVLRRHKAKQIFFWTRLNKIKYILLNDHVYTSSYKYCCCIPVLMSLFLFADVRSILSFVTVPLKSRTFPLSVFYFICYILINHCIQPHYIILQVLNALLFTNGSLHIHISLHSLPCSFLIVKCLSKGWVKRSTTSFIRGLHDHVWG